MKSYFIAGTDTDVGKTYVTAGIARHLNLEGHDVGIMKPYAAGLKKNQPYKSKDVEILANAAQINDSDELINPYFFPIPASPFTAAKQLQISIDNNLVLESFKKLSSLHEIMLVEGMGGILTPIFKNYFITNLIHDLGIDTIIVTRTRIGTVNHTLLTCKICEKFNVSIKGIIINDFDSAGYNANNLKNDLEELTNIPVLGIIPKVDSFDVNNMAKIISKNISLKDL